MTDEPRLADESGLAAAYRYCRQLNARHGKTFYLATGMLPAAKRPAVHALYGFARYADDLVDRPAAGEPAEHRLNALRRQVEQALAGGPSDHPVVRALSDTVARYRIEHSLVTDFLDSMAADLRVNRYRTFEDLVGYMWGSASVIGLQVLPVLGISPDGDESRLVVARQRAADLGVAFQLTNFLRDVGEDYRRGRIYLPQDRLAAFGVAESMLGAGSSSPELKALIAAECAHARSWYQRAEPGIALLAVESRDCVRTAWRLYRRILDEIERADHDVLLRRVRVPRRHRLQLGLRGYASALGARRGPAS